MKNKTVAKWVAYLDTPYNKEARIVTTIIDVVETDKTFKVPDQSDLSLSIGIGCVRVIRKSENTTLFDSKEEALQQLDRELSFKEQRATAKANVAQHHLWLIGQALEEHNNVGVSKAGI